MKIIEILKKVRNKYINNQVNRARLPEFQGDSLVRYRIIFSGRVQGVGFRYQMQQIALRLGLSGWVKNMEDGKVEMEIQGMDSKIDFALAFMKSLKRIKINQIEKESLSILENEQGFRIIR